MLTDAKIEANRNNAQHSTGPRTDEGKATSSRNAIKHGLTAHTILIPGEDVAELQALLHGMLDGYYPINAAETVLVLDLVDFEWRLRRAGRHEARILSEENVDYKALNSMSLHAARIKRQLSATFKELQALQKISRERNLENMKMAETITHADRILNRATHFPERGFEFTLDELKMWSAVRDRFKRARDIIASTPNPDDAEYCDIQSVPEAA